MFLNTGIPKLDDLLEGGIKRNSFVLLSASPGVKCTEFAQHILFKRLSDGDKGIYFTNNKSAAAVKKIFSEMYADAEEQQDKISFLNGYTQYQTSVISNVHEHIEDMCAQVLKKVESIQDKNIVIVFDALSSLIDIFGEESVSCVKKNLEKLKNYNVTLIMLFIEWPYEKSLIDNVRSIFDCIVDLKAVEKKVILRNYFGVSKASWLKELNQKEVPFKILVPGGIVTYLPKILVTGPYHAGKSSFIHSASIKAVSVNRLGTTVALDHGHVMHNGTLADLFGTPGQE